MKNFFKRLGWQGIMLIPFQILLIYASIEIYNYSFNNTEKLLLIGPVLIMVGSIHWQRRQYIGWGKFQDGAFGKRIEK